MTTTRVSYIAGIGKKAFISDLGQELPSSDLVTLSDAQFAKYMARKAYFKRFIKDFNNEKELAKYVEFLVTINKIQPSKRKETFEYLKYVLSKSFNEQDAHHYALAPLNPGKHSKKGSLTAIGQEMFRALQYSDKYDGIFLAIQDTLEKIQSSHDAKGAYYFLYLFLPDSSALDTMPMVAKKRKAQTRSFDLLTEAMGVYPSDLKMFVRRLTRRNFAKEPEALINELAKKNVLWVPGTAVTQYQNLSPQQQAAFAAQMQQVRGNANIGSRIGGEPITMIVIACIALITAVVGGVASYIDNKQKMKLLEAQASIQAQFAPEGGDFPQNVPPIVPDGSYTGSGGGGTGGDLISSLTSNPLLLIAAGAAVLFISKS